MDPKRRKYDPVVAAAIASANNQALEIDVTEDAQQKKPVNGTIDQIPINVIHTIMREVLPESMKISLDAKVCMQNCVNELIMFLTQEASEYCATVHKKHISAEDLIYAMEVLGFDDHYIILMKMILYGKIDVLDNNEQM